jgi:hypothetical protein
MAWSHEYSTILSALPILYNILHVQTFIYDQVMFSVAMDCIALV